MKITLFGVEVELQLDAPKDKIVLHPEVLHAIEEQAFRARGAARDVVSIRPTVSQAAEV